jgi:hypothetical protein
MKGTLDMLRLQKAPSPDARSLSSGRALRGPVGASTSPRKRGEVRRESLPEREREREREIRACTRKSSSVSAVHVRFAPKATELLHGSEMTRCANRDHAPQYSKMNLGGLGTTRAPTAAGRGFRPCGSRTLCLPLLIVIIFVESASCPSGPCR